MSASARLRASLVALAALSAATSAGAAEIALSFHDAPGGSASGFRIERRAAGAKKFEAIALVGPGGVEFVDRSAAEGKLLCYRVRALASHAEADWSTEVCAQAKAHALAAAPSAPGEGASVGAEGGQPAASNGPPAERRVRAGGGWLQVLE